MTDYEFIDKFDSLQAARMFLAFEAEHGPADSREEFETKLANIDNEINKLLLQ